MDKEVRFQVTMQIQIMYRFLMHHAYIGISGIVNMILSGGALVLFFMGVGKGDTFSRVLLLLIAALFTVINPILLLYKAAKQVKLTPMFQKPIEYIANETGIVVKQGEEELPIEWVEVRKVVETKTAIYFYLSLTRAFIFPKEAIGDQFDLFKELIRGHLKPKCCKLKAGGAR